MNDIKKILLIRTDRIGDVVLSLPMLPMLKKKFPSASISVMVRSYTRELVQHHSCVDEVLVCDDHKNISVVRSLLAGKNFDVAIHPYPRFQLALATLLARIPIRVGTGYRWYSFFFNRKMYEHRKDARRHEAEYNIQLLHALNIEPENELQFEFPISHEAHNTVSEFLLRNGITSTDNFAVLHPGSGGSARDWSAQNFSDLGDVIRGHYGFKIILTGGSNERALLQHVADAMKFQPVCIAGEFNLEELGALYTRASVFISNSTGPLHIAAIVGTPVVAFYPPIVQCSAHRWGPYTERKKIFTADNKKCFLCKGGSCKSNVCMEQITIPQVLNGITELLMKGTQRFDS